MPKLLDAIAADRPGRSGAVGRVRARPPGRGLHERTRRLINVLAGRRPGPRRHRCHAHGQPPRVLRALPGVRPHRHHLRPRSTGTGSRMRSRTCWRTSRRQGPVRRREVHRPGGRGLGRPPRRGCRALTCVVGEPASELVPWLRGRTGVRRPTRTSRRMSSSWVGPMFYTSGTTGRPKGVRGSLAGGADIPIGSDAAHRVGHDRVRACRRPLATGRPRLPLGAVGVHVLPDGRRLRQW